MNNKPNNNMTSKLQKLVKKRKIEKVVIKAGSIKRPRNSSGSTEDYYPSYSSNT